MTRTAPATPLADLLGDLGRLARRARLLLVARGTAMVAATAVGAGTAVAIVDWAVRLPGWFRLVLLIGIAAATWTAIRRALVPAWKFRPRPVDLALRIERHEPSVAGRLASGVEFAETGLGRTDPLARRSVEDVATRLRGVSVLGALRPGRPFSEMAPALALLATVAVATILFPSVASIAAQRVAWPLGSARWPARTAVEPLLDTDGPLVRARGEPIVLAARLARGDAPGERVVVRIRSKRDGAFGPAENLVLTRQPDGRYERVLEGDPRREAIEAVFLARDSESDPVAVEFAPRPKVLASTLAVRPPAYAEGSIEPLELAFGDGADDRSSLREPILAGSGIELALSLGPAGEAIDLRLPEGTNAIEVATGVGDPALRILRWKAGAEGVPETLSLDLVGARGLANGEPIRFRVPTVADRPPTAAIVEPTADESVLPTAVIRLVVEGGDDVSLGRFGITVRRAEAGGGEATEAGSTLAPVAGTRTRRDEEVDVAAIGARAGDTLTVRAIAEDRFADGDRRHPPTESAPRIFRVIPEAELARQLRAQLSAVRRAAIRLDAQQAELAAASANERFDALGERGQAQVSERIRSGREAIEAVGRRVERNRLPDAELAATVAQANDLLEAAARASAEASAALEERRGASDAAASRAAGERALARQEEVREEIEDLVELLDRDEDAWSMGRDLERLQESLSGIRDETQRLGRRTMGQSPSQLDPEDRAELNRLGERQREASAAARELVEQMRRRAESLERTDRTRAEAMRNAAERGERGRVAQELERAAAESGENRLQQAAGAQERAAATLEEMKAALEDVRRARVEELKRALASLAESIGRLVRTNEDELIALARLDPDDAEAVAERARAVTRLANNTRAVAGEARSAGAESGRIGRVIDRAADSLGSAAGLLRAAPLPVPAIRTAEERSLELLREALAATEKARQEIAEREAERVRRQLLGEYRKIAERQAGVRDATVAIRPAEAGAPLDRRALVESRRLSIAEAEIGRAVDAVAAEFPIVKESPVFAEAHRLVGDWASSASRRLQDGDLGAETVGEQELVLETLAGLIESLNESEPDRDPFAEPGEDAQAGGASGASGSGNESPLPPIAELRLLRGLQQQALDRTRRLEGRPERDADRAAVASLQERLVELADGVIRKLEPAGLGPAESGIDTRPDAPPVPRPEYRQAVPPAPPTPPTPPTPPASPPADTSPSPRPTPAGDRSLDALLGLEEEPAPTDGGAATREATRRVERKLDEKEIEGVLKQALEFMRYSAERLGTHRDTGIDTQRAQREAIERLDILIEQAKRRRPSPSPSSSSSRSSQPNEPTPGQPQPQPAGGAEESGRRDGTDGQATDGPPPEDPTGVDRMLEESGAEWGRLPERVRDLIRQGSRDRMSSLYRRLTEEYYRRIAEDASR